MLEHLIAPGVLASFFQYILAPLIGGSITAWITTLTAFPASLLHNCRVVSLQHRKDTRTPEHEYLLATLAIQTPIDEVQTRYVRIERRAGGADALRLLGRGILAEDTISISPNHANTDESYSLWDLQFSEANRPNILDFAAMLETIISLDPYYHPRDSNCYWFARMVFESMACAFSDSLVSEGEKPHRRGTFGRVFSVLNKKGVPTLGMSPSMQRWMKYRSAFAHVEAPGVDSEVSRRNDVVDDIYVLRKGRLYMQALKAEELAKVVDNAMSESPEPLYLYTILATILCCLGCLTFLHLAL